MKILPHSLAALALNGSAVDGNLITVVHQPKLLPLLADRVIGLDHGRIASTGRCRRWTGHCSTHCTRERPATARRDRRTL